LTGSIPVGAKNKIAYLTRESGVDLVCANGRHASVPRAALFGKLSSVDELRIAETLKGVTRTKRVNDEPRLVAKAMPDRKHRFHLRIFCGLRNTERRASACRQSLTKLKVTED
jgi:hypothetical protein